MRPEALFLNGVIEEVLLEIMEVQGALPEQVMFLQPHKGEGMARLREQRPTADEPLFLLISLTTDLAKVHYAAEIVGWDDKRHLADEKRRVLNRLICTLQPKEGGLYDASRMVGGKSVNLLHVRRLRRLRTPFSVGQLGKIADSEPLSEERTRAGGWSYVKAEGLTGLLV